MKLHILWYIGATNLFPNVVNEKEIVAVGSRLIKLIKIFPFRGKTFSSQLCLPAYLLKTFSYYIQSSITHVFYVYVYYNCNRERILHYQNHLQF